MRLCDARCSCQGNACRNSSGPVGPLEVGESAELIRRHAIDVLPHLAESEAIASLRRDVYRPALAARLDKRDERADAAVQGD